MSGANVGSLLRNRADAASPDAIDSETDLVLFPRLGSQMEIVESLAPPLIVCWIGNNDVLGAATSFDQLDGSQLTPIPEFIADFTQITQRLGALGGPVVFGNIPNVTQIGFLLDRQDLITFVGSDFGLAEGDFTSLVAMFLIRLGLVDGVALLQDPDWVLDANEVAVVQQRIDVFNGVIAQQAASIGMPVVNINALLAAVADNPPTLFGVTLTLRFLGGLFSLDGMHPSSFFHALLAETFIATINAHFQTDIPPIGPFGLALAFFADPAIDKDGDGRVRGRLLAGLLETLGPLLGISGDTDDLTPDTAGPQIDPARGEEFKRQFQRLAGRELPSGSEWTQSDAVAVFKHLFDVGG